MSQKDGRTDPHIGEVTDGYRHRKAPGTSPLLLCSGLISATAIAATYQLKHCFPQKSGCEVPLYNFASNNDAKIRLDIADKECLQGLYRLDTIKDILYLCTIIILTSTEFDCDSRLLHTVKILTVRLIACRLKCHYGWEFYRFVWTSAGLIRWLRQKQKASLRLDRCAIPRWVMIRTIATGIDHYLPFVDRGIE